VVEVTGCFVLVALLMTAPGQVMNGVPLPGPKAMLLIGVAL
jgi:hypothetical protein